MTDQLADGVEVRCRAALGEDAAAGPRWFAETALGGLLAAASEPERVAITVWVQRELARRHRHAGREAQQLGSYVWHLEPAWPVDVIAWALGLARDVAAAAPFNATYLLWLPYAATRKLPAELRTQLAPAWTWFADRADQLGSMWLGPRPDLARVIERLLPAEPGTPDPYRVFSQWCPLAARLRTQLPLTEPATVDLLELCRQLGIQPPGDHPTLLKQVRPLLDAGGDRPLRMAVLVALAHRPVDTTVWVRGRRERQRIWCAPSTAQVLSGALLALAEQQEGWVDPLLGAIGTHAVLVQPARLGRRPPLLTDAVEALLNRKTPAAAGELARIFAAYREELRHWSAPIERALARHGVEMQ